MYLPTIILLSFILHVLSFRNLQTQQQFSAFRIQIQGYVKQMATILQTNYNNTDCSCPTNTFYYQCQGTDDLTQFHQFPRHQSCLTDGVKMANRQTIRLPGGITQIDPNNLSCEKGAFICHAKNFQNLFQDQLKQNRNKRYAVTFVGSRTGILIKHPGSYQNCDKDYDPRIRTWYVDGSTGLKNTIIFINIKQSSNKDRAINLGQYLINTTNSGDWVSIIDLNECTNINCQVIRKGTQRSKESLTTNLDNIIVTNQNWKSSDYTNIANQMQYFFQNSGNRERNNFVVLADKIPDDLSIESEILLKGLDDYNPRFFPIIIGNQNQNFTSLQDYTNSTNGLLIQDFNTSQYANDVMNDYQTYFTLGLIINRPVWSSVYQDAFGFGKLITVTMPSYDNNGYLLGVSGIDVTVYYLMTTFGLEERQIQDQLADLYTYSESVVNVSNLASSGTASINWNDQGSQSTQICLGLTYNEFVILMVCLFIGLALVIIVIIVVRRWYKNRQMPYKQPIDNNINNN